MGRLLPAGPLRARLGPGAAAVTGLRAGVTGAAAAGEPASAGGAGHAGGCPQSAARLSARLSRGLAPVSL